MWPALTILAATALLGIAVFHLMLRIRFAQTRNQLLAELEELKDQQLQQALHARSRQEALLNSMVEGLLVLNQQGRIQLANRAFTMLFDVHRRVEGETLLEVLPLGELADLVAQLPARTDPLEHELRLPGPDERWIQVTLAAIANNDGVPHGTVLVFHDLTRLKKLERTREEFVANVSHELRTPLSLIKGYAETLLDGAKDNPQVATKFLQTIDRNAERLKLLIEDLLTISSLESGRIRLELKPVRLPQVVEKVLSDFRARSLTKGIELISQTPHLTVRADSARLEQVLGNLVDNAVKYGRSEGKVIVGARTTDDEDIEIFVRDDGPGIPPEAVERVFERFYRVDKARSREQGGTGLGLSIVKHIIQSHGGRVWAESKLGQGATFFFTLPGNHQAELSFEPQKTA